MYDIMVAGFNLVFPETLEERNSVERLLNHAQYDGGGFRYRWHGTYIRWLINNSCAHKEQSWFYLICIGRLIRSRVVTNKIWFALKYLFSFMCAQHEKDDHQKWRR